LKTLRAWKSGKLAPRIYGGIRSGDLNSDTRVHLIDGREERSVRLDADGSFSIDDLKKTQYLLRVQDRRGQGERIIDLSQLNCVYVVPWFGGIWRIAGSPADMQIPKAGIPSVLIQEPPPDLGIPSPPTAPQPIQ
jgi:hypothetical protein